MCRLLVLVLGIAGAGGVRCPSARLALAFGLGFFLHVAEYVAGDRKDMAGSERYGGREERYGGKQKIQLQLRYFDG